jgi:hypothetical protein
VTAPNMEGTHQLRQKNAFFDESEKLFEKSSPTSCKLVSETRENAKIVTKYTDLGHLFPKQN